MRPPADCWQGQRIAGPPDPRRAKRIRLSEAVNAGPGDNASRSRPMAGGCDPSQRRRSVTDSCACSIRTRSWRRAARTAETSAARRGQTDRQGRRGNGEQTITGKTSSTAPALPLPACDRSSRPHQQAALVIPSPVTEIALGEQTRPEADRSARAGGLVGVLECPHLLFRVRDLVSKRERNMAEHGREPPGVKTHGESVGAAVRLCAPAGWLAPAS